MRELLIVRHAPAHERDRRRWPDDGERPLTRPGAKKFRRVAKGIAMLGIEPDEVLCSPLVRTRQTARILKRCARFPRAQRLQELRPDGDTRTLLAALRKRHAERIAIVGHEPALSRLICTLLADQNVGTAFALKKGAIAWLAFDRGKARLLAFMPPKLLARLGRGD